MRLDNWRTLGCVAPSSRASRLISASLYGRPALSLPAFSPLPSRGYSCLPLPFGVICLGSDLPFESYLVSYYACSGFRNWVRSRSAPTSSRAYPAHNKASEATPVRPPRTASLPERFIRDVPGDCVAGNAALTAFAALPRCLAPEQGRFTGAERPDRLRRPGHSDR